MEINIMATNGTCDQFTGEDNERKEITVFIAPLKVTTNESGERLTVASGCNMWKSCYNEGCWYSQAARFKKRKD